VVDSDDLMGTAKSTPASRADRAAAPDRLNLRPYIRDIPDFPTKGILFRDITPLLKHGPAFRRAIRELARTHRQVLPDAVVAIESRWLRTMQGATLYRYIMPPATFRSLEDYGAYVSRDPVIPVAVQEMPDLVGAMAAAHVESRVCPSLRPLADEIVKSTLHWSLVRMRHAVD
jgi:hypothetical protein